MRAARVAARMSTRELGRAVGRSKSAVSRWEQGESPPSLKILQAISVVTGQPLPHPGGWGDSRYDESPQPTGRLSSAQLKQVLEDLDEIPSEEAQRLVAHIHFVAEQSRKFRQMAMRVVSPPKREPPPAK